MKKIFFILGISTICMTSAHAALNWWDQPTVCRVNNTNCYTPMGAGYDTELWDVSGNCRGRKLICPAALTAGGTEPVAMEKRDIQSGIGIHQDYDVTVLADGCFGARKIIQTPKGPMASLNGKQVEVFCRGILNNTRENPVEIVSTGEIATKHQPTCQELADNGYAAVLNGKCFGKFYDPAQYFIECGAPLLPTHLIVLNGADYAASATNTPSTQAKADELFKRMVDTSAAKRKEHTKTTE